MDATPGSKWSHRGVLQQPVSLRPANYFSQASAWTPADQCVIILLSFKRVIKWVGEPRSPTANTMGMVMVTIITANAIEYDGENDASLFSRARRIRSRNRIELPYRPKNTAKPKPTN